MNRTVQPRDNSADADEILSIAEVHALLGEDGISRAAIYAAIRRGDLPHLRLGGRILVSREWITKQLHGAQGK